MTTTILIVAKTSCKSSLAPYPSDNNHSFMDSSREVKVGSRNWTFETSGVEIHCFGWGFQEVRENEGSRNRDLHNVSVSVDWSIASTLWIGF